MDKKFFLWNLDLNDALTTTLTSKVIIIALGVAVVCFICNLAYNYLKSGYTNFVSSSKDKFPDYEEIARCFIIILCISVYLPVSKIIVGSMEVINKATAVSPEYINEFARNAQTYIDEQQKIIDPDQLEEEVLKEEAADPASAYQEYAQHETSVSNEDNTNGGILKTLRRIANFLNPINMLALGFHAMILMVLSIVKIIITGIAVVMVKVLVILGPLAFAFSILPVFSKQLSIWFGTLVNAGMVFTTINILDAIIYAMFSHIFNADKGLSDSLSIHYETVALDVIIIVLYCSAFWLTSKYVGKGDAGRALSKMVGIATAATMMVLSGGTSAAATSSNLGNAASVGKDIVNKSGE